MTRDSVHVGESDLKEYFQSPDSASIFVALNHHARHLWRKNISKDASGYFRLPDGHWLASTEKSDVTHWLDAYNNDSQALVERIRPHVSWSDRTPTGFFVHSELVLLTHWAEFLSQWTSFLAIDDDCPIVLPFPESDDPGLDAFVFTPLGAVRHLRRRQ